MVVEFQGQVTQRPDAWRSLGWLTPAPETGLRWLPAEYFGPLPEE
jgi:hypothetical protein